MLERTGGAAALAGFFFQLDVSVWAALDLEAAAARLTPGQLRGRLPSIAALMSAVVGERASEAHVMECARAVADLPDRRMLLVPLMIGAFAERRHLAEAIGKFLPSDRVDLLFAALDGGLRLKRSAFEDLGEVRIVDEVVYLFSGLFDPPDGE
ncbi:MAG TPA: hypothetical protein VK679_19405 [Gemmatimonadaceae bacterium]|jgi:hypothetical protein|nr:hypothetical protein [Gemmatimonadaceae bacterium]